MDSRLLIIGLVAFMSLAAFSATVDYYNSSNSANAKTYSQAIDSYNNAERRAEKMLSLSIMQNLDAELYATNDKADLYKLHNCMHRMTLNSDVSLQYKTVFLACAKGL